MTSCLQSLLSIFFLAMTLPLMTRSVPISRTSSRRPQSVSIFNPAASYASPANSLLRSRAISNSRIASALYGGGISHAYPMAGAGLGYSSYNSGYGGGISPHYNGYGMYQPAHSTSSFENYQTGHPLLGHATTSKRSNQYVTNNFGFPSLGGSYEHSTNVYGGVAAAYPGVYAPIGAKYGKYGSYDPFGYGGHGEYQVTPHYTKVTHTQTIPNHRVNKLAGYGK